MVLQTCTQMQHRISIELNAMPIAIAVDCEQFMWELFTQTEHTTLCTCAD